MRERGFQAEETTYTQYRDVAWQDVLSEEQTFYMTSEGDQNVPPQNNESLACRQRMPPAISANKGCSDHQPLRLPPWYTLRGFRMEKNRILALDS